MREDPYRAFMPYPDAAAPSAPAGALQGLSFAVKDVIDVAGYPTGCGNPVKLAASGVRTKTAPVVQALLDAGARFAGKTQTDEFAYSILGRNIHFGSPVNPAAPGRISGGSSSGSAVAVAARQVDFALGTDTAGSLRAPASYCGVFGIRPTWGRVDNAGVEPLSPSYDTVGWFARSAETLAAVGDVLLGDDPTPLPGAARFLVDRACFGLARPEAAAALEVALRRVELRLGCFDIAAAAPNLDNLCWALRHMQSWEAWEAHKTFIERHAPVMNASLAERFASGKDVTETLLAESRALAARFRNHLADLLGEGTVLVLPTMPSPPPFLAEAEASMEDFRNRTLRLMCPSSLSGFPQVTIPVHDGETGPLGLSLLGPAGSDRSLIQLAARVAEAARERIA
ncbi:amidase [Camelimonas lactis]|uniref:Amidase n=1 Tax=Camelimonas lactis TaxID=659006 RepID=A0A4R2GMD1_9HYPH|nr:amidase [Camelimonas lactis]TCO09521.1 amidase [Camelimonas lactis]